MFENSAINVENNKVEIEVSNKAEANKIIAEE